MEYLNELLFCFDNEVVICRRLFGSDNSFSYGMSIGICLGLQRSAYSYCNLFPNDLKLREFVDVNFNLREFIGC